MTYLKDLRSELSEIAYLYQALGLLGWDQQTYMPPGAAESRALQESALHKACHDRFTADSLGKLLDGAAAEVAGLGEETLDFQIVRMAAYDYDRARKLPADFVAEKAHAGSIAQAVWAEARKTDNFAQFAPYLEKNLNLARRTVEYLGYEDQPYDALLGSFEPKITTREVAALFDEVRPVVVDLVKKAEAGGNPISADILTGVYPEKAQEEFGRMVVSAFGYDWNRGRLDRTVHPFASAFGKDDCRITTRYDPTFLSMALMGTMHETGHAMYEQNTGDDLRGTPLAEGCSNSLHESQSRLWENLVGRSLPFWRRYFPALQRTFPDRLSGESAESIYRALNRIEPSFIRVEADEVTYNLHIALRFEMEQDLLMDRLKVSDAPAAWNAKMQQYLGIAPPTDREGILQDVHWAFGGMGYFPTYSLGNFVSAQIFAAVHRDIPSVEDEIDRGEFKSLFDWLESHVWRYGRRYFPQEMIQKATGRRMETAPYIAYLKKKFGDLYGIEIGAPAV